jgi:hypothetical protein
LGGVKEINKLEWSISGGELDRRQIDVRPLFEILGVWTFVLAETFCMNLNYEIPSWELCAGFVFAGGSDESGSVTVVVHALLMSECSMLDQSQAMQ